MSHAERCPICLGTGEVPVHDYTGAKKKCHGCGGSGWVIVNDYPIYPILPLYPEYLPYYTLVYRNCR